MVYAVAFRAYFHNVLFMSAVVVLLVTHAHLRAVIFLSLYLIFCVATAGGALSYERPHAINDSQPDSVLSFIALGSPYLSCDWMGMIVMGGCAGCLPKMLSLRRKTLRGVAWGHWLSLPRCAGPAGWWWEIETPPGAMAGHVAGPWHSVCGHPGDFVT